MKSFTTYLNEASLSRVFQHVEAGKAIATLTANRGDVSKTENEANNKALGLLIRQAGYGYVQVQGHYVEEGIGPVVEKSFFIVDNLNDPERLKDFVVSAGKRFTQDSIFYRTPEGVNYLISTNANSFIGAVGKMFEIGNGFSPMKMGAFYSKIKGRPYVFESCIDERQAATGYNAAMLRTKMAEALNEYGIDGVEKYCKDREI